MFGKQFKLPAFGLRKSLSKLQKSNKNRKPVESKRFRLVVSPQVFSIKRQFVLKPFQIVFSQFPVKIQELSELVADGSKYSAFRDDICTPTTIFAVPPSLKQLKDSGDSQQSVCCNFNRQYPVFVTYDGYIAANSHLIQLVTLLESYYDFYTGWASLFQKALQLLKTPSQDENNLDSEIQDASMMFVAEISDKIKSFQECVDICSSRFELVVKIQKYPHIADYRTQLTVFEREQWFLLCLTLRSLYHYYVMTYDFVAKNSPKLIRSINEIK